MGDKGVSIPPTFNDALLSLAPDSAWSHSGDYATLVWYEQGVDQPTEEEVQAELARLLSEHKRLEYARSRAAEYPPIGDQLDALYHAGAFPDEMAAMIEAVKAKYPKPE